MQEKGLRVLPKAMRHNSEKPKVAQAKEHRLFQLSERLTNLFQEYEFSRNEELIYFWNLGKSAIDISDLGPENWQKELWNGLFGYHGKVTKYNT